MEIELMLFLLGRLILKGKSLKGKLLKYCGKFITKVKNIFREILK
jgi:putative sterol carrier protein